MTFSFFFFFNDTATTEIYTLSLHDALPIYPIHRAVERVAVPRLETRGVDENELGGRGGAHAAKAMPGGLRLARGDAELLSQQCVEQRGFSDVGASDQRDRAAAERLRDHRDAAAQLRICAKARNAASCSAVRRLLPLPVVRTESSGIRHSTSKLWLCAAPRVATTEYCGSAIFLA